MDTDLPFNASISALTFFGILFLISSQPDGTLFLPWRNSGKSWDRHHTGSRVSFEFMGYDGPDYRIWVCHLPLERYNTFVEARGLHHGELFRLDKDQEVVLGLESAGAWRRARFSFLALSHTAGHGNNVASPPLGSIDIVCPTQTPQSFIPTYMMSGRRADQALNTACQRCRRRKVKCDLKAPRCSNCTRADVRCVSAGLNSSRAASSLPPGYLESLEAELSQLQAQAARAEQGLISGTNPQSEPSATSTPVPRGLQDGVTPFDWSTIGEVDSGKLHPRLAYGIKNMVRDALSIDNSVPFHSREPNSFPGVAQLPFPSQDHPLAPEYLTSYFDHVHSCLPFLHENMKEPTELLDRQRLSSDMGSPILPMVLAIGAILRPGRNPITTYNAIVFHNAAVESFESLPPSSSIQTVQFLLLATIFSLYSPTGGSTWHLLGLAIQVSITLGLHHRRGIALQGEDRLIAENIFWSTCVLDRLISATLGRPYGIVDQDITTELPEKEDIPSNIWYLTLVARASSQSTAAALGSSPLNDEFQQTCSELSQRPLSGGCCDVFGSIAFQLVVENLQNQLKMHRLWLSHCQDQKRDSAPLPWVSGYTIFHAVVLQKCAQRLQALDNLGERNEIADASALLEAAIECLLSISFTFRGLESLVRLSRHLLSPSRAQETEVGDLEAVQSESIRAAVTTLISLTPRNAV
ncbi:C6 transcription factor [Fusarium albosuccineum]|uniref:C6 transcription factor n=1 Tax=Fusarium albosuccineum TaxID=1237068 RepID=A0A8H4LA67_9HYPO|nr:C6 transcription factor [Fusarium albosuccineum]